MSATRAVAEVFPSGPDTVHAFCLNRARRCAMRARLDRRFDRTALPELPRHDGNARDSDALELLVKLMPTALGRRVIFHRPGAEATTFDEAWLLRLMHSIRSGDEDSIAFALASRVERRLHRTVRRLAERSARES